jgi:hypothetical protein
MEYKHLKLLLLLFDNFVFISAHALLFLNKWFIQIYSNISSMNKWVDAHQFLKEASINERASLIIIDYHLLDFGGGQPLWDFTTSSHIKGFHNSLN